MMVPDARYSSRILFRIVCYGWWIIEWIYRDHDRIVYADAGSWSTRIANRYNDGIVTGRSLLSVYRYTLLSNRS